MIPIGGSESSWVKPWILSLHQTSVDILQINCIPAKLLFEVLCDSVFYKTHINRGLNSGWPFSLKKWQYYLYFWKDIHIMSDTAMWLKGNTLFSIYEWCKMGGVALGTLHVKKKGTSKWSHLLKLSCVLSFFIIPWHSVMILAWPRNRTHDGKTIQAKSGLVMTSAQLCGHRIMAHYLQQNLDIAIPVSHIWY